MGPKYLKFAASNRKESAMPRPKKIRSGEMTPQERMEALTRLLALGIVRLAAHEKARKERERTGLSRPLKRSLSHKQHAERKGETW
jgi:hypothetical protein